MRVTKKAMYDIELDGEELSLIIAALNHGDDRSKQLSAEIMVAAGGDGPVRLGRAKKSAPLSTTALAVDPEDEDMVERLASGNLRLPQEGVAPVADDDPRLKESQAISERWGSDLSDMQVSEE